MGLSVPKNRLELTLAPESHSRFTMNTSICSPEPGDHVKLYSDRTIEVSGYAYGTNGSD